MRWEPRTLNPFRSVDSASYYAQSLVFAGLLRYSGEGVIEPDLAETFEIRQSPASEAVHYVFRLRSDLKFSDGSPISVADVIRSIKEAAGERSPFQKNFQLLDRITSHNNEIVVTFRGPDASLPARFVDLKVLPARSLDNKKISEGSIASGAFVVKKWIPGQQIIFEPNPNYWDSKPGYKELAWRVIPNRKLIAMALVRKEIDIASVDGRETEQLLKEAPYLAVEKLRGARVVFLGFNTANWPWSEVAVRRSLSMMLNRKQINEKLFGDYSTIPRSEFDSYKQDVKKGWQYQPQKAAQLLKESGFTRDEKSWTYKSKDGLNPLALKLVTVKDFLDLGQTVISSFKREGIKAELEIVEYSTLKDQYLKEGKFDLVLFSRSVGPVPDPRMFWTSTGRLNYSSFHSTKLDKLIRHGSNAPTLAEKQNYNAQVGEILASQVPWIYISRPNLLLVHRKGISNLASMEQSKTGLPWNNPFLNARKWRLPN